MPPDQPGQAQFLFAQATKGRGEPSYAEAVEDSKHFSGEYCTLRSLSEDHQ